MADRATTLHDMRQAGAAIVRELDEFAPADLNHLEGLLHHMTVYVALKRDLAADEEACLEQIRLDDERRAEIDALLHTDEAEEAWTAKQDGN